MKKKSILSLLIVGGGIFVSSLLTNCTKVEDSKNVLTEKTLSAADCNNLFDVYHNTCENVSPIINASITRAIENDEEDYYTSSDSLVLLAEGEKIIKASKELLYSLDFTDEELVELMGEDYGYTIAAVALICSSATFEQSFMTRGITGNEYLDCAIAALGLDLGSSVRTIVSEGVSKAVVKKMLTSSLKLALGDTVGIVVTVALWGLCVGGMS